MNSGALIDVTNTIDTYVYRGLTTLNNVGMSGRRRLLSVHRWIHSGTDRQYDRPQWSAVKMHCFNGDE